MSSSPVSPTPHLHMPALGSLVSVAIAPSASHPTAGDVAGAVVSPSPASPIAVSEGSPTAPSAATGTAGALGGIGAEGSATVVAGVLLCADASVVISLRSTPAATAAATAAAAAAATAAAAGAAGAGAVGAGAALTPAAIAAAFAAPSTGTLVIPRTQILSIISLASPTTPSSLSSLSSDAMNAKFAKALALRAAETEKINPSASPLGQRVFFALDRTLRCAWDGDTIVVAGSGRVASPYTAENVSAPTVAEAERLKRMVSNLRV